MKKPLWQSFMYNSSVYVWPHVEDAFRAVLPRRLHWSIFHRTIPGRPGYPMWHPAYWSVRFRPKNERPFEGLSYPDGPSSSSNSSSK